ncbi:coiled-coil domain-containing protein 159 [Protobothrops mucrosquamatus]|uniref:coiled-coil domain-containing protein 159 n=1 Tax=Protobothrops mucrosquamatus TaxID=103944 RepID=UPI000775E0F6|nr:coiled-coil domain-containing protein 159 [Protobothrops mucrosquamatus]
MEDLGITTGSTNRLPDVNQLSTLQINTTNGPITLSKSRAQRQRSTTMTLANDEQNHINSPNWCLARASSPASASIPESHLALKNDVELIRAQLHAQTEAFQALSHSITLLEQESNYQQGRINALEEEVKFAAHLSRGEMFDELIQKKIQELWKTMNKEVEGLQSSMVQKQSSMENLSQDVLESKKFLWEELESVQGELRRIHQKLSK